MAILMETEVLAGLKVNWVLHCELYILNSEEAGPPGVEKKEVQH
jgi:hypothetical protein